MITIKLTNDEFFGVYSQLVSINPEDTKFHIKLIKVLRIFEDHLNSIREVIKGKTDEERSIILKEVSELEVKEFILDEIPMKLKREQTLAMLYLIKEEE